MNYFTKILIISALIIFDTNVVVAQKGGALAVEYKKKLIVDGPGEWINISLATGIFQIKEGTLYLYHPSNSIVIDSVNSAFPALTDSLQWTQKEVDFTYNGASSYRWVETRIRWKAKEITDTWRFQAPFLRVKARAPKGIIGEEISLMFFNTFSKNQLIDKDGIVYFPEATGANVGILRKEVAIFALRDTVVRPGSKFCQDLNLLQNETHLVALQMDYAWDPQKVRLDTILQREIPSSSTTPFSRNFSSIAKAQNTGRLRISWISRNISVDSLAIVPKPSQALFAFCFTALDSLGTSFFNIDKKETIEIYTKELQFLNFTLLNGKLQVSPKPELWPGDTNADGVVNHFDFLPIGLTYGQLGDRRKNPEIDTWGSTIGFDWERELPRSTVDLKNVDTDGNGVIDNLDINLISQFWNNRTQPGIQSTPEIRATGAPLTINTQDIFASKPTALTINLGTEQEKAETVYGLAFAIEYDPAKINAEKIAFVPSKSWLGDPNADLIYFQYNDTEAGKLYIALSRVDGQARNGFGPIGDLLLQANATAGDKTTTELQISETLAIDPQQNQQGLSTEKTELNISTTVKTQEPLWAQYLRVTPSLSKGEVWIQATQNLQVQALECIDAQGRVLFSKTGAAATSLNLSNYSNGMYVLRIQTNEGTLNRRIMLQK